MENILYELTVIFKASDILDSPTNKKDTIKNRYSNISIFSIKTKK